MRYKENNKIIYCKDTYIKKCDNNEYKIFYNKKYYKGCLIHREDGPAVKWPNGGELWYINGKLHRVDGPAVELFNKKKSWYLNGKEYTGEEYKNIMNLKKKCEVLSEI